MYWIFYVILALLVLSTPVLSAAITADHSTVTDFATIPPSIIDAIAADYHIYYVHTSHGSQIISGISMVESEDAAYDPPYYYEVSDDLGHNGDTSWVPNTRTYLNAHPECDMAMFSWCGGCSDNTEEGINIYLNKMEELEADYPKVTFIYMTGHLDGTGVAGNLYLRNNQIRDYCMANDKILFDFADIESYDPEGVYYPDETDYCNWCTAWCAAHPADCPACGGCAHSQCFNCFQKGKAWWWMMATISGWSPSVSECGDANSDGTLNVGDATYLIGYVFKGGIGPSPLCRGDANGDGSINIGDVVYLINYVFKNGDPPIEPCCL
ncbi:MAG: hypothetical protein GY841_20410 [FCB group bacterium]|nr:hypothetical protein [FCB group bacterium]